MAPGRYITAERTVITRPPASADPEYFEVAPGVYRHRVWHAAREAINASIDRQIGTGHPEAAAAFGIA